MSALLMNWKSTAAVSGVTVLAGWLGWTPTRDSSVSDAPVAPRQAQSTTVADIQEQAARLQMRVRTELGYHDPTRNPFRFVVRPVPAPRPVPPAPPAVAPAPVVDVLPFSLSGMATDTVDGQTMRTAIVISGSDVVFAKEGDRVGTYTVTRIDDTGVDVTGADGTRRRLTLTP